MKVILLETISNLGKVGDQVTVKAGFGRNYLLPTGKVLPASAHNIKIFEARRKELEAKEATNVQAAQQQAEQLQNLRLTITKRVSEEGKLYGSLGQADIMNALSQAGYDIKKNQIVLPQSSIRELGEYDVDIELYHEVKASIQVEVVEETTK